MVGGHGINRMANRTHHHSILMFRIILVTNHKHLPAGRQSKLSTLKRLNELTRRRRGSAEKWPCQKSRGGIPPRADIFIQTYSSFRISLGWHKATGQGDRTDRQTTGKMKVLVGTHEH